MTATTQAVDTVVGDRRRTATRLMILGSIPVTLLAALIAFAIFGGLISVVVGLIAAVVLGGGVGVAYGSVMRAAAVPGLLRLSGARPVSDTEFPRYTNLIEGLCISSGIEEPELFVLDDEHCNVMVIGRPGQAAVVATTGLLAGLNRVELEGVLAEALMRIRTLDAHLATQAAVFICGPLLRNGPVIPGRPMWMVTPFAGLRARRLAAISGDERHLVADLAAFSITRYPPGLRDAMLKMDESGTVVTECAWGTAHLWMCDPLASAGEGTPEARLNTLFRLHPPLQHRIDLLGEL